MRRIPLESYDFFKPECKDRLALVKGGDYTPPESQKEDLKRVRFWDKSQFSLPAPVPHVLTLDASDVENVEPPIMLAGDVEPSVVPWKFAQITKEEVVSIDNHRRVKREEEDALFDKNEKLAKQMKNNFINVEKHRRKAQSANVVTDEPPNGWLSMKHKQLSEEVAASVIDIDAEAELVEAVAVGLADADPAEAAFAAAQAMDVDEDVFGFLVRRRLLSVAVGYSARLRSFR